MKLVKAWSGKWHQFQSEHKIVPEIDGVTSWSKIPKPERLQVLTTCGEFVMVKAECDDFVPALTRSGHPTPPRNMRNFCSKCWPVVLNQWGE